MQNEGINLEKLRIHRSPEGGSRKHIGVLFTAAAVIVVLAGLYFARSAAIQPSDKVQLRPAAQVSAQGERKEAPLAEPIKAGLLNATGYVVAERRAAVASKATGRLVELRVEEGDQVKRNQVLGTIENEDLKAFVREREANVEALTAMIRASQAELADARSNRDRALRLRSERVSSEEQFDAAEMRFEKALASVGSAEANLRLSQAQLERAKVDLSYTAILAPFDGTVITKNADVGEIVAPFGSSSTARAAIVTIADMSSLEVEADVSEANLGKVFVGQKCVITLDSLPGRRYEGRVSKIVPTVDRAKATVLTKIRFDQYGSEVIPEMSAKIAFILEGEDGK